MRKVQRRICLLVISVIILAGFLAAEATDIEDRANVTTPTSNGAFLSPGFNGVSFSTNGPPRRVDEYLFGEKDATQHSILSGGTDTLSTDIPNGWNPIDLSAKVYQLSANQSFSRNSQFSDTYSLGGRTHPSYWTNRTNDSNKIKPEWNTTQEVYIEIVNTGSIGSSDYASWSQQVYANGTNLMQAKLVFDVKKYPSALGTGNDGKTFADASINGAQVFSKSYTSLNTSYDKQIIDVTSRIPSLPNTVNITLFLRFSSPLSGTSKGYVYFDNVYLYVNCTVPPQSIALQLNEAAVLGQQYGTGNAHLQGSLTIPFTFNSNTTGRIRFKCNSTIGIYRGRSSDSVIFTAVQGLPVNNNVSKASFFNGSSGDWTLGSTAYNRDILNISIPHDWTYSSVILPNGTVVEGESVGRIQKYENGSYSWIIRINATSIGRYGPEPYIIRATSPNYLSTISTFRKITGDWVPRDLFVNGSRIMINATILGGGASQGNAYVVFYNASDYSVWRNMSAYAVTPGVGGVASFNFNWENSNSTRSDLVTLVLWKNSGEAGAGWIPISFDLVRPQVKITLPSSSQFWRGMVDITVSITDLHAKNVTLFINGGQVGTWTTSTAVYPWNTKTFSDGPATLKVEGWDEVDHKNITTYQVTVDNTPPILTTNLPANYSYVRQLVTLTAAITDANPKNVTIYIGGLPSSMASSGYTTSFWDTRTYPDGIVELEAISWDQAGSLNRTRSFVYVDNTLPVFQMSLPALDQYVAGNITMDILCTDIHFKNVTLLIGGVEARSWSYEHPSYRWNTTTYADGAYALTIRGWDLAGNKNETVMMIAHVDNTPPSVPGLVYPNNGEEFNSTTLGRPLSWNAASDLGSGVDHYVLQLDNSPYFNSVNVRTISWSVTSYSIPDDVPLRNGTWYWRVCAADRLGNIGGYSEARLFQVIEELPSAPEGLPLPLMLGLAGAIPAIAILSSVILLRRRKAEPETYDTKNLLAAYVFSSDGRAMFTHQFKEVKVEPQLISGFLTAISEMMKEVVGGDRRPLSTVERSDAKIIIERGTEVSGALVTRKSSREYRRRLRAFLRRFEDDYADRIANWDGDQSVFQTAPEAIEEVFCEKAEVATYPTIGGLEDLLFSGKLGGVAVSVVGKTGSGKTEFCLRYASSLLKREKPVIVIAASLEPKDVRDDLKNNNADVAEAEKAGNLHIYDAYSEISGVRSAEKLKFGSPGELNNINLSLSRNLSELKNATIIFDSLSAMVDYSELELVVDFIRTIKAKISQGGHTAFFIIDSNAHSKSQLNYLLSVMDGEIETVAETSKKGETEMLVSFKRLKGFKIKPGYHQFK